MVLTTLMLTAALFTGQQPMPEAQKGWIIEIRGYTYHAQTPKELIIEPVFPKEMQPGNAPKADVIEGKYVDDLGAFFERLRAPRINAVEGIYVDDLRAYLEGLKKSKP
jgi:hypothetical protein